MILAKQVLLMAPLAALVFSTAPALSQDWGDSPYVPTPQSVVDKMLEVGKVGSNDFVVDLGSGDGRIVITAAKKFGARGFGVDIDPRLVERSKKLAAQAGVSKRAAFYARDLYQTDISNATVLTMYLLPEVVLMARPKLLAELKPGARIVSHDYDLGEWQPDFEVEIDAPDKPVGLKKISKILYWVVPAKASGKWRWQLAADGGAEDFELSLTQMFQKIDGTLSVGGRSVKIEGGKLDGANIRFEAAVMTGGAKQRYEFSGRLADKQIEGQAKVTGGRAAQALAWKAVRTEYLEPAHTALKPPPMPQIPH